MMTKLKRLMHPGSGILFNLVKTAKFVLSMSRLIFIGGCETKMIWSNYANHNEHHFLVTSEQIQTVANLLRMRHICITINAKGQNNLRAFSVSHGP